MDCMLNSSWIPCHSISYYSPQAFLPFHPQSQAKISRFAKPQSPHFSISCGPPSRNLVLCRPRNGKLELHRVWRASVASGTSVFTETERRTEAEEAEEEGEGDDGEDEEEDEEEDWERDALVYRQGRLEFLDSEWAEMSIKRVNVEIFVGEDEPIDSVIRRFNREVHRQGIMDEVKRRRYHETTQEKKKRKRRALQRANSRSRRYRQRKFAERKRSAGASTQEEEDSDDETLEKWDMNTGDGP
eukprot:TRINITY_DN2348_c0_g1_i1.p1 TRINITY_DN2348_c0_g1~~TRINITY_DN2348_c0_g1_i1.p1  ORF type:complete len:243 (+),score=39.80 TRINITY_DN2348_c0_g1_i1:286-1014(+)